MRSFLSRQIPLVGLSGTLTKKQLAALPGNLGLVDPVLVQHTPDRPNIVLERQTKMTSADVATVYEGIFMPECLKLRADPDYYPVTLMYLPLQWAAEASAYCHHIFGLDEVNVTNCRFASIYSNQTKSVTEAVTAELKKANPRVRLVFCTSAIGMGFDSCSITRVIHAKPPRNLSDYFQEVSRAGRAGQQSHAILHFGPGDISANIKGLKADIVEYCRTSGCLRETILSSYSFHKDQSSPVGCKCCSNCKVSCDCDACFALQVAMMP